MSEKTNSPYHQLLATFYPTISRYRLSLFFRFLPHRVHHRPRLSLRNQFSPHDRVNHAILRIRGNNNRVVVHSIPRIQPCNGLPQKKILFSNTHTLHQRTANFASLKNFTLSEMDLKWGEMGGSLLVQFRPPHSPSLWLFTTGWKWESVVGINRKVNSVLGRDYPGEKKTKEIIKDSWDKDIGCVGSGNYRPFCDFSTKRFRWNAMEFFIFSWCSSQFIAKD